MLCPLARVFAACATLVVVFAACGPFAVKKGDDTSADEKSATTETTGTEAPPPTDSDTATATSTATSTDQGEEPCQFWCPEEKPESHVVCTPPAGAPASLAKIADLVKLLNLLPRPVSIACLLDVLPKPVELTATRGKVSLQPAHDSSNPRLFFFLGSMILSVVPDGPDRDLLEVSELLDDARSVKGELLFPLKDAIAPTAFYDRIKRTDGIEGTTCSACHDGEAPQPGAAYGGKAFFSRALRPVDSEVVPWGVLKELRQGCEGDPAPRCDVFRALLGQDEDDAKERLFPPTMPTMF